MQFLKAKIHGYQRDLGFISGTTFYTKRWGGNLFKQFNGFGISEPVLDYLFENDVIDVNVAWNGSVFNFNLMDFFTSGIPYDDRGDNQLIIKLNMARSVE